MTQSYTVGLAVYDYVPVLLSSVGLFIVAQLFRRSAPTAGVVVLTGWVLVTIGGLSKATWKLVLGWTDGQTDIRWLDNSLFIFMAAGFVVVAIGVRAGIGKGTRPWAWALAIGLPAYGAAGWAALATTGRLWFFILLGTAAAANVWAASQLARYSHRLGRHGVAGLFWINLVVILVLPGFARVPDQTIALQWIEQSVNFVAQSAFVVAAWLLSRTLAQSAN